jgi:hypothetical protein
MHFIMTGAGHGRKRVVGVFVAALFCVVGGIAR